MKSGHVISAVACLAAILAVGQTFRAQEAAREWSEKSREVAVARDEVESMRAQRDRERARAASRW